MSILYQTFTWSGYFFDSSNASPFSFIGSSALLFCSNGLFSLSTGQGRRPSTQYIAISRSSSFGFSTSLISISFYSDGADDPDELLLDSEDEPDKLEEPELDELDSELVELLLLDELLELLDESDELGDLLDEYDDQDELLLCEELEELFDELDEFDELLLDSELDELLDESDELGELLDE